MKYEIRFPSTSVEKKFYDELHGFPEEFQERIYDEIEKLADNPRPKGEPKIKPPTEVYNYTAQYRVRIGNVRVLYDVDDKRKIVWILAVRKRDERTYK